jgi:catechol 2,3-dioxygenase-like lactoylglutathione lyase family enzyme
MDLSIHYAFLCHTDPDASLAFYRDVLGFEVRNDVGYGGMRWITVGPAGGSGPSRVHRLCWISASRTRSAGRSPR